jgi:hypothetical protein
VIHKDKDVDDDVDSGDGSEDDEDTDDKIMMFEYVSDLIPSLSKAMGMEFKIFFIKMYTSLMLLTQKNHDVDEKIQVMGTFAQTFKHIPVLIEIYQDKFIRLFEELLKENDDEINRNVAFGAGVFCQKGTQAMLTHFPRVLKVLSQIFEESTSLESKENALAAIARMIMASPENVPVEEVNNMNINTFNILFAKCLQKIISNAPFKGDLEEEKTIIKMLIFLCQKSQYILT